MPQRRHLTRKSQRHWKRNGKGFKMEKKEMLKYVDHTLLTQGATWEEIRQILDDGMKYETASACIQASDVKQAADYVEGKLPICTVIGFPNGYSTTAVKVFETKDAIANGASEIDMVINIGWLKDKKYEALEDEIRQIHEDRKSTRLNSSHVSISYAVFCLKKKKNQENRHE